jgi:S-DNA-T family DNA segregation ATPase FtsK/SpoIIIE
MTTAGSERGDDSPTQRTPRGPVLGRVCDAMSELRELTEDRSRTLAAIEAARETTVAEAVRRYERETADARAELEGTLVAAESEQRQRDADTAQRYDATIRTHHNERRMQLDEAQEKATAKRESIESETRDARWLITSVHDSDVAQAHARARARIEALDRVAVAVREARQARLDLFDDLGRTPPDTSGDPGEPEVAHGVEKRIECANEAIDDARDALAKLAGSPFPRVSRGAGFGVFAVVALLLGAGAGFAAGGLQVGTELYIGLGAGLVVAAGGWSGFGALGARLVATQDKRCTAGIGRADTLERRAREAAEAELREAMEEIERATEREQHAVESKHTERLERLERQHAQRVADIDASCTPKIQRLEASRDAEREETERRRRSIDEQAHERFDRLTEQSRAERDRSVDEANREADESRAHLDARWREAEPRLKREIVALHEAGTRHAPAWPSTTTNADTDPPPMVRIGWARWDVPERAAGEPVAWSGPRTIELPIPLEFPRVGSLLIEAAPAQRRGAIDCVRGAMLRLLTTIPPAKVRLTIFDPVGLGESFAGFMHLADHQEQLVSGRIWTEPRHIEQRLLDLTEHMESVIQKYLRNDYPTIEAYNRAAGEIAEPYRYLVISDFPTNVSEGAAKRIASIVSSGARCGVHTIILRSPQSEPPKTITLDELYAGALVIRIDEDASITCHGHDELSHARITLDTPPDDAQAKALLREVGERSLDAGRVQVPFSAVGPGEGEAWTLSAATDLRIPIGRSGASKVQQLVLGEGTAQHALIAGRTGSGKSTLFHVIITSCAAWYSTDEVELYLVDFKKGVEFKPYATHALPHARVIAIETDRAFGLSVLTRIDEELTERGERMRRAEVQNLASFREKTGERMPRVLLIVDEFQELFVEDDQIAQQSALLLDRIVRQGRAFGVHVVLGSQTLGGAYAINRATMSQMNVRIALQCDEQDSYLILGEDNSAARLLERPGEAVYNAQGGKVEANSPFQIVWLPDTVRDEELGRIAARAASRGTRTPEATVFEGNAPADPLRTPALVTPADEPAGAHDPIPVHLGVPVAIAPPVAAMLERERAENLLILSTNADAARAMLATSLLGFDRRMRSTPGALAYLVHHPGDDARYSMEAFVRALEIDARVGTSAGVADTLAEVDAEIERRSLMGGQGEPPVLIVIAGVHRCRDITKPDDLGFSFGDDAPTTPSPGALLDRVLRDGPPLGVHTLAWVDTLDAFERALDRRRLSDFAHRVLTQMNAMDSSTVLDSPAASRLSQGRALYYNDRTTQTVVLRPYAFPALG